MCQKKKGMRQCLECAVHPQGKLGGCTVISCGVTLNYTTYYLNLRNTGANPSRKKKKSKNHFYYFKNQKKLSGSFSFRKMSVPCKHSETSVIPEWYAARGYYTAVRAALIHWPISDIL